MVGGWMMVNKMSRKDTRAHPIHDIGVGILYLMSVFFGKWCAYSVASFSSSQYSMGVWPIVLQLGADLWKRECGYLWTSGYYFMFSCIEFCRLFVIYLLVQSFFDFFFPPFERDSTCFFALVGTLDFRDDGGPGPTKW